MGSGHRVAGRPGLRIVGGLRRGHRLHVPPGNGTRPTSDRAREAVFNILGHRLFRRPDGSERLPGAGVLDVFAGTGAFGLEAWSRGADRVTFLEKAAPALTALTANIAALQAGGACRILVQDACRPETTTEPRDLMFLDPPYGDGLAGPALTALLQQGWLKENGLVVLEGSAAMPVPTNLPPVLEVIEERRYGASRFLFLTRQTASVKSSV